MKDDAASVDVDGVRTLELEPRTFTPDHAAGRALRHLRLYAASGTPAVELWSLVRAIPTAELTDRATQDVSG